MALEALSSDRYATGGVGDIAEGIEVDVVLDERAEDEDGGGAPGVGEVDGRERARGACECRELATVGSSAEGEGESGAVFDDVEVVEGSERGEVGAGASDGEDAGAESKGGDGGGGVTDYAAEPSFTCDLVNADRTDQKYWFGSRSGHGSSSAAGRRG